MSIFIPYSPTEVMTTLTTWYNVDLINLTGYQTMILTLISNVYFFVFWYFVIYFVLKSLNWVYERLF